MSNENALECLVIRLQAIAKMNGDQFRYKIDIEPTRNGIQYVFICEETVDSHALLTGNGATIEAAVADAEKDVGQACQEWGYDTDKAK